MSQRVSRAERRARQGRSRAGIQRRLDAGETTIVLPAGEEIIVGRPIVLPLGEQIRLVGSGTLVARGGEWRLVGRKQ